MGKGQLEEKDFDGEDVDYPTLYLHGALDGSYSSLARAFFGDSMQI